MQLLSSGREVTCFAPGSRNQRRSSLGSDRRIVAGGLWKPASGCPNFLSVIDRDGDHYAFGSWNDFIKCIQSNDGERIDDDGDWSL